MDSLSDNGEGDCDLSTGSGEETIAEELRQQNFNLFNPTLYNFDDGNCRCI